MFIVCDLCYWFFDSYMLYTVGHHFQHLSTCVLVQLLFGLWLQLCAVSQITAMSSFYLLVYCCCYCSVVCSGVNHQLQFPLQSI